MLNVREKFLFSYARSARRAGGHHRASEPSAARMCKTALGTRGARGASSQQMSARKRKRPDRCSGALISCHSTPLDPCVQQQRRHCIGREAAEDKGHHHVVARQALPLESVRFLIGLQERCSPDELDDTTATFAGRGKRVWTLWPHCMGSSVNATAAGQARLAANQILDALAACPACGALAADHTVHEVSMLAYVGAGAAAPVHKDSALPGTSVPLRQQGALLCTLQQECQGGILHVARRECGEIKCRDGSGNGPRDIGRDAVAINMSAGDACMIANVDHMVTRVASGSRAVLSARISCPMQRQRSMR